MSISIQSNTLERETLPILLPKRLTQVGMRSSRGEPESMGCSMSYATLGLTLPILIGCVKNLEQVLECWLSRVDVHQAFDIESFLSPALELIPASTKIPNTMGDP
jgi:hypothetical protein